MTFEPENSMTLGAVEEFERQHRISSNKKFPIGRLAIVLQWNTPGNLHQLYIFISIFY
jgi:hypothetical protein